MARANLLRSALRWLRNRRPAAPQGHRLAGVMATRDYTDACGAVTSLRAVCDVVIVLDDNSATPFPLADRCDEVLVLRNAGPWNATENLTLLLLRSFVHGCEWVLSLDDDILLPAGLQTRGDAAGLLNEMAARDADVLFLRERDLWESPTAVREDGLWGTKTFATLRRNWFFQDGLVMQNPAARLHRGAFPAASRLRPWVHSSLTVYHAGSYTAAMRRGRVERYRREDPENRFQRDYAYILDDARPTLRAVPPEDAEAVRRRFRPDLLLPR